jgi:hypothetical protein
MSKSNIIISDINGLLTDPIFQNCFVCGHEKFCEFFNQGHLYRICSPCLKTEKVKNFFVKRERSECILKLPRSEQK